MTLDASGSVICTENGMRQLVITREYPALIEDVWASLTESERTARWIGPWTGDGRPGGTIYLQMTAEEGAPAEPSRITACDAPRFLALETMVPGVGQWTFEVELTEVEGTTTLEFRQTLAPDQKAADSGAGWEYYLDRFSAALNDQEPPAWDIYPESMNAYYEELDDTIVCGGS